MKIGIIGAMESEVSVLKETMKVDRIITRAGMNFYDGSLEGTPAVVVMSGVGKVNAGICVQVLVDLFEVTHVMNTGVAGALNPQLDIGDILVSEKAIQHDMDVRPLGYQLGQIPGFESREYPADPSMVEAAVAACRRVNPDLTVLTGCVVSGDQFISDNDARKRLVEEFSGDCAEMEGGAIAQAAFLNRIPYIVIRAISDKADSSADMDYPTFEAQAADHCAKMTIEFVKSYSGE